MPTALFTSENASEMGRKGGSAPRRIVERPKATPSDRYQARRLTRIRKQLDLVDAEILEAIRAGDSKRGKELSEMSWRLSDQEFALANRPKPAQARVTPQGRTRRELPPPMPIQEPEASKPTSGDVPPQSITPSQPASPGASGT